MCRMVEVIAASTAIAQQGGANWAQSYGDATVQSVPALRYVAPVDRFTGSDLGYAGKVTRHHRAARALEPAPAQEH